MMMIRSTTTTTSRRTWTDDEDAKLAKAVKFVQGRSSSPIKWSIVATHVPGRTNKECRKRWHSKVACKVRKGAWDPDEDEQLLKAVRLYGCKWSSVAKHVGTRTGDQCGKRWTDALNPNINRRPWTEEEDARLLDAVATRGSVWSQIVADFPGRTGLSAKNRYDHLRRAIKSGKKRKLSSHRVAEVRDVEAEVDMGPSSWSSWSSSGSPFPSSGAGSSPASVSPRSHPSSLSQAFQQSYRDGMRAAHSRSNSSTSDSTTTTTTTEASSTTTHDLVGNCATLSPALLAIAETLLLPFSPSISHCSLMIDPPAGSTLSTAPTSQPSSRPPSPSPSTSFRSSPIAPPASLITERGVVGPGCSFWRPRDRDTGKEGTICGGVLPTSTSTSMSLISRDEPCAPWVTQETTSWSKLPFIYDDSHDLTLPWCKPDAETEAEAVAVAVTDHRRYWRPGMSEAQLLWQDDCVRSLLGYE